MGSLALAALALFGTAAAAAGEAPPLYDGGMSFRSIQGPEGAEEYSWTVQLEPDQALVPVDDRHAEVRYDEGRVGFRIEATAAHDAEGANVPTTLAVSGEDLITLTVHHRAGNPLAGGAPFRYPIVAGVGWEGGFRTHTFLMPPGEVQKSSPPPPPCVVPRLAGRSLAATRTRLTAAGCALGAVRGKRGKGAKVVKQFRAAGTVLGTGARVAIKLG